MELLTTYATGSLVIARGDRGLARRAERLAADVFLSGSDEPDAMAARRCREDFRAVVSVGVFPGRSTDE